MGTAISATGESVIFYINATPAHHAGAYGVAVFLDDVNYSTIDQVKVCSLVIRMQEAEVTVNSTAIEAGNDIPENFITVDNIDGGANVYAIYSGVTIGVCVVLPEGAVQPEADVDTVGKLRACLAEHPSDALGEMGFNRPLYNSLFAAVAVNVELPEQVKGNHPQGPWKSSLRSRKWATACLCTLMPPEERASTR